MKKISTLHICIFKTRVNEAFSWWYSSSILYRITEAISWLHGVINGHTRKRIVVEGTIKIVVRYKENIIYATRNDGKAPIWPKSHLGRVGPDKSKDQLGCGSYFWAPKFCIRFSQIWNLYWLFVLIIIYISNFKSIA